MVTSPHPAALVRGRTHRGTRALTVIAMAAAVGAVVPACGTVSATATPARTAAAARPSSTARAPVTAAGVACRPEVPVVRPTHVPISCGDGSAFAVHVRWTSLDRTTGKAMGVVLLNDCTPNCAQGHFRAYAARLDFTRVATVAHRPMFTRLLITFTTRHPAGAKTMAARY